MTPRELLLEAWKAALAALEPGQLLAGRLPEPPRGRTLVLGAGKAAAAHAAALEALWPGELGGMVVTRRGHGVATRHIEVREASHPVPDEASLRAGSDALEMAAGLGEDDMLIALISGGGSALLVAPQGISLERKQRLTRELLASGAPIGEINRVRIALSRVKGGRLALAAHPATVHSYLLSDVTGDPFHLIAGGPTVPSRQTVGGARDILARHGLLDRELLEVLQRPEAIAPDPADPRFARHRAILLGSGRTALDGAAGVLREAGYVIVDLGDRVEGPAQRVAREHAGLARRALEDGRRVAILSAGETTVKVESPAPGARGGRNLVFALSVAIEFRGAPVHVLAADTDGIDGNSEAAGAIVDPDSLDRALAAGADPIAALRDFDSEAVFRASGDLLVTGPTLTNVSDLRVILVN